MTTDLSGRLPWGRLKQPDELSCGAACLVVARMLTDEEYAEQVLPRFSEEVLETHARIVGRYPRRLGTPPWPLSRELTAHLPGRYTVTRPPFWVLLAALAEQPAAIYVGNRLLPRHVVLGLGSGEGCWVVYDPARGGLVTVDREHASDRLPFGRWHRMWWAVTAEHPG